MSNGTLLLAICWSFVAAAPELVMAQTPVRLPTVTTTAERQPPGARILTGTVRDTSGVTIDGVEISIPKLQRRRIGGDDGSFRFDSIPRGTYSIRARKLGYAPQIRVFEVGRDGGLANFELLPFARALPAVVISAVAGGLSGIVGDTAFNGVPAAEIRLNAKSLLTQTDSTGAFFLAAPPGNYMVSIKKSGYKDKVVSVTIPEDGGRRMSVFLTPFSGAIPVRELWNVADMGARLAWRHPLKDVFYTREDMITLGVEWAHELVRRGGQAPYDKDCRVIVDGGPTTTVLSTLTVDDLEGMEIYNSARAGVRPPMRVYNRQAADQFTERRRVADSQIAPGSSGNTERALFENQGMFCPIVYVWLR